MSEQVRHFTKTYTRRDERTGEEETEELACVEVFDFESNALSQMPLRAWEKLKHMRRYNAAATEKRRAALAESRAAAEAAFSEE